MYKNIIFPIIFAVTLLFSVVVVPTRAFAQSVQGGGYNSSSQQGIGTTTQTNAANNDGFNWLWLLPLLAIPALFLFRRDSQDDDRTYYRERGLAGMKGGEVHHIPEDDAEE